MAGSLEREIKLRFDSTDAARTAVLGLDTTLVRPRRLQSDIILDTEDARLSGARSAKALTACTSSRKLAKAGRYTLGCKLTSAVRSARRRGSVRVLLRTTFTPTGGAARTITRVVTLKKTSSGVTG